MTEWERCRPWVEAALENQAKRSGFVTHTADDVRDQIDRDEARLWPFPDAAAVTEIVDYPQTRVLHLWLCAGSWAQMEAALPTVLEYGRDMGCRWATTAGRVGWRRIMEKHGFKPIAEICGRAL